MASYAELKAQAEALLAQAEEIRKVEKAAVIGEIKLQIAQYQITARDLGFSVSAKGVTQPEVLPRFKGPNGELWSGLGRQPQWLKEAMAKGQSKTDFAI